MKKSIILLLILFLVSILVEAQQPIPITSLARSSNALMTIQTNANRYQSYQYFTTAWGDTLLNFMQANPNWLGTYLPAGAVNIAAAGNNLQFTQGGTFRWTSDTTSLGEWIPQFTVSPLLSGGLINQRLIGVGALANKYIGISGQDNLGLYMDGYPDIYLRNSQIQDTSLAAGNYYPRVDEEGKVEFMPSDGIYAGSNTMQYDTTIVSAKDTVSSVISFKGFERFEVQNLNVLPDSTAYLYTIPSLNAAGRVWSNGFVNDEKYLYLYGQNVDSFYIYDISDNTNYQLISKIETGLSPGTQPSMIKNGDNVYVQGTTASNNFVKINVSDVYNPTAEVGSFGGASPGAAFEIKDERLFVISSAVGVISYDITDFTTPIAIDTFLLTSDQISTSTRLRIQGDNLFYLRPGGSAGNYVFVFDISQTDISLSLLDTIVTTSPLYSTFSDGYLYTLASSNFRVYQIMEDEVVFMDSLAVGSPSSPSYNLEKQGDFIYAANTGGWCDVFNIRSKSDIFYAKKIITFNSNRPISVYGKRLVAGSRNDGWGLQVLDIGGISASNITAGTGVFDNITTNIINSNLKTNSRGEIVPAPQESEVFAALSAQNTSDQILTTAVNNTFRFQNISFTSGSNITLTADTLINFLAVGVYEVSLDGRFESSASPEPTSVQFVQQGVGIADLGANFLFSITTDDQITPFKRIFEVTALPAAIYIINEATTWASGSVLFLATSSLNVKRLY